MGTLSLQSRIEELRKQIEMKDGVIRQQAIRLERAGGKITKLKHKIRQLRMQIILNQGEPSEYAEDGP